MQEILYGSKMTVRCCAQRCRHGETPHLRNGAGYDCSVRGLCSVCPSQRVTNVHLHSMQGDPAPCPLFCVYALPVPCCLSLRAGLCKVAAVHVHGAQDTEGQRGGQRCIGEVGPHPCSTRVMYISIRGPYPAACRTGFRFTLPFSSFIPMISGWLRAAFFPFQARVQCQCIRPNEDSVLLYL